MKKTIAFFITLASATIGYTSAATISPGIAAGSQAITSAIGSSQAVGVGTAASAAAIALFASGGSDSSNTGTTTTTSTISSR